MSLHDALYRERPNSLLALPLALAITAGYWDVTPWPWQAWLIVVFLWLLAALCLVTDVMVAYD